MKSVPLSALLLSSLMAVSAHASVLMFDFGPTTVSGANLTNSPYHSVNGSAGTSWNKISTSDDGDNKAVPDVTSGLLFADGTAATGVGINLGVATGTIVGLGTQPTRNSALGGVYNTGIYSTGSVGRDGIFPGTNVALGVQITGLAAGTYDVYLSTRNTNYNEKQYREISYAAAGIAGADYNYSGYETSSLTFAAGAPALNTWVQGQGYVKFTVNIAGGEALNLAVIGESDIGGADRGFLNSLQIVSVPEPSYGLMACGLLATLVFRRQARRG